MYAYIYIYICIYIYIYAEAVIAEAKMTVAHCPITCLSVRLMSRRVVGRNSHCEVAPAHVTCRLFAAISVLYFSCDHR